MVERSFLFIFAALIFFLFQEKQKTHQLTSLTNLGDNAIPALTSTIEDRVSPMKSVETTASLVMPRMPSKTFFFF